MDTENGPIGLQLQSSEPIRLYECFHPEIKEFLSDEQLVDLLMNDVPTNAVVSMMMGVRQD